MIDDGLELFIRWMMAVLSLALVFVVLVLLAKLLTRALIVFIGDGLVDGLGRRGRRGWQWQLRNASIVESCEFGPDSEASPGMVRLTLHADGLLVYDFELTVAGFLEHVAHEQHSEIDVRRAAGLIRAS